MTRHLDLEGWSRQKIWTCFDIVNGATPASGTTHFWDGDISWVGPADLGKLSSTEIYYGEKNLTLSGYKSCGTTLVPKGTIILSARAPIGHIAVAGKELCFNQGCKGLRLKEDVEQSFAYWLIMSLKVRLEAAGQGTTFVELSRSKLKDIDFLLPPHPEQRAIAAFLDKKCAAIDEAVRIKEAQITLLRERRQILIQQAVTRGLNPNAPLKDSGIDWIGQIPAHWEVRRGKYLFREVNERSEEGIEELLSVSHTTGVTARSEKNVNMFLAEDYTGSKLCQPGDIVINTMWAWMGALGVSDTTGIVSPSYGVYRPVQKRSFNRRFLEWLLRTTPFIEQYNKISTGLHSSRLRLYPHMFLGMFVAFPSRKEQDAIVAHVDNEAGEIDKAISIKQSRITALKEYKAVLINAAVTGKIKVTADRLSGTEMSDV
ncbi:MAG: restriction endonuclease subunit S [Nitrococcus sp.]|nr:restriction endonuclease subunit S [Nitrococcus sp.]